MKKAWRTTCCEVVSITATEKRSGAVMRTLDSALECGFRATWQKIRAVRAKEFDLWAEFDTTASLWCENDLRRTIDARARELCK